ncbi:hypothetical protein IH992_09630 [Candidatus Poribacteria bacterium]|nr:hypothetical protein [Candidatus Poribacteria bacterium]
MWQNNGVEICRATAIQGSPRVIWNQDKVITVWQDKDGHLYPQAVGHAGQILWDQEGVTIRSNSVDMGFPEIL